MDSDEPTEMIDRVIDDRYQLTHVIGAGPHADVFVAIDSVERRNVAVKVFHPVFGEDPDLSKRMLRQLERTAALDHPNLVSIFDWGTDGTALWVAMELCEGGSLRTMIDAGGRLTNSQALVMTLECARALEHGHRQDMVHRSVRPENILFDAEGRVRLSDFGLGQVTGQAAVSRSSWSVDLVRYASPEQARGRLVDRHSDIYSLALVVNEAVTGIEPSTKDTAVGTMMARAETSLEVGVALGPLRSPIERCGRVDSELRPDADELAIALLAAAETLPAPTAFPVAGIAGYEPVGDNAMLDNATLDDLEGPKTADVPVISLDPDGDYADYVDDGPIDGSTVDGSTADSSAGPILVPVPDLPDRVVLDDLSAVEPVFAGQPEGNAELDVPTAPVSRSSVAYREDDDDLDQLLPKWPLIALAVIAGGLLALVAAVLFSGGTGPAAVPEVVGSDIADLESALGADNDWQVNVLETRLNGSLPGIIVSQDPVAGSTLDDDGALTVTVSLGNEMVEIPSDLSGLTLEQAQTRLTGSRLVMGAVTEENSESLESGLVISVDEPTRQKPEGEAVSLRVSLGPTARVVPASIVGATIGDATAQLAGLRLQAVEEQVYDPLAAPGTVLSAVPGPGEAVPADSQIALVVSAGPEPVSLPDLEGFVLADAYDALEALGLVVQDTEGVPGEPVLETIPPAGEIVDVGAEIIIVLAEPEDSEDE